MSNQPPVNMETIERLETAVFPALALLAGCKLDVFTSLVNGPQNSEQLAAGLGVDPARLRPLLYALVTAGLLTVSEGEFRNTAEADCYLVKGKPHYIGSRYELWEETWQAGLKTAESIRTGKPQAGDQFDFAGTPPEKLAKLFRGLHGGTLATGRMLARRYDFSGYQTILDAGGGSGGLALGLTESVPGLLATVAELPSVARITQRFIDAAGAGNRVRVVSADLVHDELPGEYDAAVLRAVLQTLSPEDAARAIANVGKVVKPGGANYVIGAVLDDSRLSPPEIVADNLMYLNAYKGGQAHTEQEHREWLRAAGFVDIKRDSIYAGRSIIRAIRAESEVAFT